MSFSQPPPLKTKIMVATPAFGGLCYVNFVLSLMNSKQYLAQHGIALDIRFLANESLIPRGRNTLTARFMNDETFTHLLFIDADVSWMPGTIMRLIRHNKEIVGALYPKKGYDFKKLLKNKKILELLKTAEAEERDLTDREADDIRAKLLSFVVNREANQSAVQNGLLQVKHIGTGFMLIQRNVIQKMFNAYPELKHDDDIGALSAEENKYMYALFDCENHKFGSKTHYLSEDYLFCKRWTDLGGSIYADISIPLTHTGTHPFSGSWATCNNITFSASPAAVTTENTTSTDTKGATMDEAVEHPEPEEYPVLEIERVSNPKAGPEPKIIRQLTEAKTVAPLTAPPLAAPATNINVQLNEAAAPAPPKQRLLPSQLAQIKIL